MRKLIVTIICALVAGVASAQKYVPTIKAGSVLRYAALSRALGQTVPLSLSVVSIDSAVTLKWAVEEYGSGTIIIPPPAVKSGDKMILRDPEPDAVKTLKPNQTLAMLSQSSFNSLLTNHSFVLNGQTFNVASNATPFLINNKEADVLYAVTANGKTSLVILNKPDFPLICKLTGGPQGIDLTLTGVTE